MSEKNENNKAENKDLETSEVQNEGQQTQNTTENEERQPQDNEEEAAGQETESGNQTEEETSQDPLEVANERNAKLQDQLLRTIAEFENYKKRTLKEKTELILNGGEKTITALLPILDDFERALADNSNDLEAVKEGIQMIFNKFVKTLEGMGVKKIETQDKDFDVDFHEAIAMVPGMGDDKKGKVIDCVQTGYTMNEKVIRHAKVAVGQ